MVKKFTNQLQKKELEKSRLTVGLFSSRTDEWETPQYVFDELNQEFDFQLDVCATSENMKCKKYFHKKIDGLKQEWSPYRCWMNPPYGKNIVYWIKKAHHESERGALVVCLIPARTDTKWWHEYVMRSSEVRFISGRLNFGHEKQSAPFPSCVVIFYPELDNPNKLTVPIIKSVRYDKKTQMFKINGN